MSRMWKRVGFATIFFLMFLFIVTNGFAMVLRQSIEELTLKSKRILTGEVVEIKSEWNEERTTIYTYVTVLVEQDIKGSSDKNEVTIRVPGGTVEDVTLKVSDVAQFSPGEKVAVFLQDDELGYYRVRGWFQGKYTIKNDKVIEKNIRLKDFIGQIYGIMKKHGLQEEISPTKAIDALPSTLQKRPTHIYNEGISNKKKILKKKYLKKKIPNTSLHCFSLPVQPAGILL